MSGDFDCWHCGAAQDPKVFAERDEARAEVERLKAEHKKWLNTARCLHVGNAERIAELEADNAKLATALDLAVKTSDLWQAKAHQHQWLYDQVAEVSARYPMTVGRHFAKD